MHKAFIALALGLAALAGCQSSSSSPASPAQSSAASASPQPSSPTTNVPPAPPASPSGDPVRQKLQELAGSGATDCGRVKFQPQGAQDDTRNASSCAMQAAQARRPFFVTYELPGLIVAIAGNSQGKFFSVQSEQPKGKPEVPQVSSSPCTAELRVADSGRVTCMPKGSMATKGGPNPHGGMTMPPTGNPHSGMSMPPPGTPNPHGDFAPLPRTGKSGSSSQ